MYVSSSSITIVNGNSVPSWICVCYME